MSIVTEPTTGNVVLSSEFKCLGRLRPTYREPERQTGGDWRKRLSWRDQNIIEITTHLDSKGERRNKAMGGNPSG